MGLNRAKKRALTPQKILLYLLPVFSVVSLVLLLTKSERQQHQPQVQDRKEETDRGKSTIQQHSFWDNLVNEKWSCPLYYQRTTYEEVREYLIKPYILGGLQRPKCINCHKDKLWAHFCQYQSHGPLCSDGDQQYLLSMLIDRAETGASAAKELLTLTPCEVFQLIEGRTIWLVGDSMTQEFQKALQCFLFEFWELEIYDPKILTQDQPARSALGKFKTNWCVFLLRDTNICHLRSNYGIHLSQIALPSLIRMGASKSDILLLNVGVWHNRMADFAGNLSEVQTYLQTHQDQLPFLLWREVAPQHFDTPLGEFGCDYCPLPDPPYKCAEVSDMRLGLDNALESNDPGKEILVRGGWRNSVAQPIMESLGIPIVPVWNLSMPYWQFHYNYGKKRDCTHMCHPSAYQLWIHPFHQMLLQQRHRLPPVTPKPPGWVPHDKTPLP